MEKNLKNIFSKLKLHQDGIFGKCLVNDKQLNEINLRKKVANLSYKDLLFEIGKHHSIKVMDREVIKFLSNIKKDGVIIDVGGCWGWHWRYLNSFRPDIKVVIVDFVRENLFKAKELLGKEINRSVFLVHGNAINLNFPNDVFDGYWSVQCIQHIPDYKKVYEEAYRVLKKNSILLNYALNYAIFIKIVFMVFRKKYIEEGDWDSTKMYLRRMNKKEIKYAKEIFKSKEKISFSEIIFHPELRIYNPGLKDSFLGNIDSKMSSSLKILSLFARQISLKLIKV